MTNIIRSPYLLVTLNGSTLSDVITARVQHGFNMRVAEATVTLRALPTGIQPWDSVVITMGGTQATAEVRFTGYFISHSNQLYPKETTLICKGILVKAETYEAMSTVDMTSYAAYIADPQQDDSYGHYDQTMISTVLENCTCIPLGSVPEEVTTGCIGGTSKILGKTAKGKGFDWRKGETGLSFIERLDSVCLGYRTYDTFDGTIKRTQITSVPSGTSSFTFTEGVDIYKATDTITVLEARNRIVVEGYPGEDSNEEIDFKVEKGNPFLMKMDGGQWYLTEKISSAMIEKEYTSSPGDGLSCEEVANWQVGELNNYSEKMILTTPRDDLIEPGIIITVISPIRLGITSKKFWVQEVDAEISRQGSFSQILTCISSIPITESKNIAIVVPPEYQ